MGSKAKDRLQRVEVRSRSQWRAWLEANHMRTESIWLVRYKKQMGDLSVPYDDIVEEALCFGWIDSLPRALDQKRTMLLISPRRPKSVWSDLNKKRVARLMRNGLMAPAGLQKVRQAKRDGSWKTLENLDRIPADFAAALAQNAKAAEYFSSASPSMRRAYVAWIQSAKREETRLRRIREAVRLVAGNLRPDGAPLNSKKRQKN